MAPGSNKDDADFSEKEAQARFAAALRACLKTVPKTKSNPK
jgi:hypothetical protein